MGRVKSKIPITINLTLLVIVVTLLVTIYGYFKASQDSQAQEITALRIDVTELQSKPVIDSTKEIKEIASCMNLNTKSIAVLQANQAAMNAKLDLIVQQNRDLNRKIDIYIARTPSR
jgi:hypothetical protein